MRTVLAFFLCVALGGIAWFTVFARSFTGIDSAANVHRPVLIWWIGGAFAVSVLAGALQRAFRLIWSTGFAVPMLGWGLLCALAALTDPIGVLWWTAYGIATTATAFLGAWIGRTLGGRVHDKVQSTNS